MTKFTDKAMLVSVSIPYWVGTASDKTVLEEIHVKHNIDHDMQNYRKSLVDPAAMAGVRNVRNRARAYHFNKTLPWIDDGTRILPSALYFEYAEKMREFKDEYDAAVAQFVANYSKMKGEARRRLGSLYREEDYPPESTLRGKFGWQMNVFPIPSSQDWRVKLGDEADADVQKQIDERVTAAFTHATQDLWQRLYVEVQALAVKMKETDPKFRNSIIDNIKAVVDILPVMNVAGDAKLTALGAEVKAALTKLSLEELRTEPKSRKKAAATADAILAKMAGYIGER